MALTISAVNLGFYASDYFCARCAWLRLHLKTLPFQSFPGIFSSIDRYNKLIVLSHFERAGSIPVWLRDLGEVSTYFTPPHWTSFSVLDQETYVTLRGEADGIFKMVDGSHTIVDYKTARYTPGQRGIFPAYEAQLNAYAYIGERLGLSPISRLALVYMEPLTDEQTAGNPHLVDDEGFSMGFKANVVEVDVRPNELIPPLLRKVTEISEMDRPPKGLPDCRDCDALDALTAALGRPT